MRNWHFSSFQILIEIASLFERKEFCLIPPENTWAIVELRFENTFNSGASVNIFSFINFQCPDIKVLLTITIESIRKHQKP